MIIMIGMIVVLLCLLSSSHLVCYTQGHIPGCLLDLRGREISRASKEHISEDEDQDIPYKSSYSEPH